MVHDHESLGPVRITLAITWPQGAFSSQEANKVAAQVNGRVSTPSHRFFEALSYEGLHYHLQELKASCRLVEELRNAMRNLIRLLGTAVLLTATIPASASVTSNADTKIKTYSNDGDGMSYVISGGNKKSIAYDEVLKAPLDAKGQVRYLANESKILSVIGQPGRAGLTYSRPLSDLEVAQINQALIQVTQASSANLAIDPKADPGAVFDSFDALRGDDKCMIAFYEKAVDVCGERFGRTGVVNWTMFNQQVCNAYGGWCIGRINFNIGYQSLEGRRAIAISFLNRKASDRFIQVFSSWSGSVPQRI